MITIEKLDAAAARAAHPALVALLQDAVASGASIGFLPPLNDGDARHYWDGVIEDVAQGARVLLAAWEGGAMVGTVQLDLCQRPNGLHRAEVAKLMVHTAARRRGIGAALMTEVEAEARRAGRTTLFLDTREGDPSERLYARMGFSRVGVIPAYALSATGALDGSAFYYRLLG